MEEKNTSRILLSKLYGKEGHIKNESDKKPKYTNFIRIHTDQSQECIITDMLKTMTDNYFEKRRDLFLSITEIQFKSGNFSIVDDMKILSTLIFKSGLSTLNFSKDDFNYDEETIKNANEGFLLWEEREFEKAKKPLRLAAEKNHLYSMTKCGLISFYKIVEKQKLLIGNEIDIPDTQLSLIELNTFISAIDLLLKASIRGDDNAINFFANKIIKDFKEERCDIYVNKNGYGPTQVFNFLGGLPYKFTFTEEVTLSELLEQVPTEYIYKWLKSENYKLGTNIRAYPVEIKNILKIYFLNLYYQTFKRGKIKGLEELSPYNREESLCINDDENWDKKLSFEENIMECLKKKGFIEDQTL